VTTLDETALRALLRKYETLLTLRRTLPEGPLPSALRPTLKQLADEFPGALRELDSIATEELEQRRDAVCAALKGGAQPSWMAPLFVYHTLMRLALDVRALLRAGDRAAALRLLGTSPFALEERFLDALDAPPRGRMSAVVFELLCRLYGREMAELRRALFPRPPAGFGAPVRLT
jgi:hypothetical protein